MTMSPPPPPPPPNLVPPVPGPPPDGSGGAGGSVGSGSSGRVAVIAVLAVVVVLAVVTVAFLIGRSASSGSDDESVLQSSARRSTTTAVPTTTTTTTSTTTTVVPPTVPPAAPPTTLGDVRGQPPGLFCRDLRARGFSYPAAVDYWRTQGQPERLDADRDGIPCETVYPTSDVVSYWGTQGVTPQIRSTTVYDLPAGLLCRQLADRGYSVYDAIDYYLNWGGPRNMDADGNGIPCETVYADAAQVWNSGSGD